MESNIKLDGVRTVSFKVAGHNPVTLTFRRITADDWKQFFGRITVESENVTNGRIDRMDFRTAGLALVDDTLEDASGYFVNTPDGPKSLTTLANWKDRIPYTHKVKAAELLQDVTVFEEQEQNAEAPEQGIVLMAEVDEVRLEASWGSATPGTMDVYKPLVHRFRPATAKQQQRYSRASSESKVVGGSRTGRTIYPVRHALLAELYDELVVDVDGYEVGGVKLDASYIEAIKANMDTYHKVCAVQQLFVNSSLE